MPNGYTYHHFEWLARVGYAQLDRPDEFEILLYDDEADQLEFRDDLDAITTEPKDGNYTRSVLEFPEDIEIARNASAGYMDVRPKEVVFDFHDVSGEVDFAGVAWRAWLHDDDGEPGDPDPPLHLMARCRLDERYDLSSVKGTYPLELSWQFHHLF